MMVSKRRAAVLGFTLVELMIVLALVAIILAVAIPSFTSTLARKRLEGVASELSTDMQYARSEAVQRNAAVRIIVGTSCYAVHVVGTTPASNCTTLGTAAIELKTVQIAGGTSLAFVSNNGMAFLEFEPVRGMALDAGGADSSGYVTLTSSAGNWQVQAIVTQFGRVKLCSPNNTVSGLATDCT